VCVCTCAFACLHFIELGFYGYLRREFATENDGSRLGKKKYDTYMYTCIYMQVLHEGYLQREFATKNDGSRLGEKI
jgi:hypothetical protein